jgi:hypothetical protein
MILMLRHRFRQDALPLALYLLTFVIMSYPFVLHMHDHLPMDNVDTHTALWQNWWMLEALTQGHDLNHSDILFYPTGLDVTLQPRRWSTLPIWTPLYLLFGDPLAFNLTAMIGILFKAYGMYLLGLWLFKKRIPAWVSGAFYAFAATNVQQAFQHPNSGATEWIPWFMLVFVYGISQLKTTQNPRKNLAIMVLAGFLFAMNAYANLKIALFAMLLGGGYVVLVMLAYRLWRVRLFWLAMLIFGVSAVGFSSPILIPTLQSANLEEAVSDGVVVRGGVDILSYVKAEHRRPYNYMQSIASLRGEQLQIQNIWGMSHVGVVSIAFALMGLRHVITFRRTIQVQHGKNPVKDKRRLGFELHLNRLILIWGILALVFWLLSLGIEFHYNRHYVNVYWTPYRILEHNIIFQILKLPWRMSMVFLFPYSILIGYGLHYRLRSLTLARLQSGLLIFSVSMLLYGTSIFPIPMRPAPRPAYIDVLASVEDGAVVDLPFGRHNAKYYMSVQRFHQRPMIEGMIARTPPDAYDYIEINPILSAIRGRSDTTLDDVSASDWETAIQQLWDDGFRYVILHKFVPQALVRIEYPDESVVGLFASFDPIYDDDEVTIYAMDTLLSDAPQALSNQP